MSSDLERALSDEQRQRLDEYAVLLRRFNQRINMVSREDEAHLRSRHIPHCLALAARSFPPGSSVVDWGTGGGLPAIPLAIVFPEITVYGVDSVGKKVQAVRAMARRLGLTNLLAWHGRAEQWTGTAHYSVSRATAPLDDLWRWHRRVAEPVDAPPNGAWSSGLICLKGGDLRAEIEALRDGDPAAQVDQQSIRPWYDDAYFADKYTVAVARKAG